uniref:Bifunctional folD protein putative n=1 Tax=Albugo laibachii Nc14 TaxID=890382 RepID=F0WDC7_9STRA|nr:bifunctional folD protein putative [Albugo laibachii Nc14]|eukprot:CCA19199.1 bifunctional folD protein putative [Albugo laibachii Nc14]
MLLDGKACSKLIENEVNEEVKLLSVHPKLDIVLVLENADSETYVLLKKKACSRVEILCDIHKLGKEVNATEIEALIDKLNDDVNVHGILLQLPLPCTLAKHTKQLLHRIDPKKDVDGLHPHHFHHLSQPRCNSDDLFLEPCTPAGCLALLDRYKIDVAGKDVVVIGRSPLVGLPLSLMLLQRNATVTICHSNTRNLQAKVKQADILVAATGCPQLVQKHWLKENVVILDIGINYCKDTTSTKGYKIVGDVHFEDCESIASAITPVPGGIGPMTVAMLLKNILKCAKYAVR